jgi:hypothetical protein
VAAKIHFALWRECNSLWLCRVQKITHKKQCFMAVFIVAGLGVGDCDSWF